MATLPSGGWCRGPRSFLPVQGSCWEVGSCLLKSFAWSIAFIERFKSPRGFSAAQPHCLSLPAKGEVGHPLKVDWKEGHPVLVVLRSESGKDMGTKVPRENPEHRGARGHSLETQPQSCLLGPCRRLASGFVQFKLSP